MKTITKLNIACGIVLVILLTMIFRYVSADFGKILCPVCQEKEMTSIVYVGGTLGTLMYCQPYYDEEGNYHYEDPNTYTTSYSCSKGHEWSVSRCGNEEWSSIDKDTENEIIIIEELEAITLDDTDELDFFDDDYIKWTRDFFSMWFEGDILYVETQDGKWFVEMEKMGE